MKIVLLNPENFKRLILKTSAKAKSNAIVKPNEGKNKNRSPTVAPLRMNILFVGVTVVRSDDWKSNIALFQRGVEVSPNSSRTQYSLATEYFASAAEAGDMNERNKYLNMALKHFDLSLKVLPNNFQALYNMGISYAVIGDTVKAIERYHKAIQLDPYYTSAINNLAVIYEKQLEFDSSIYYYEMAFKSDTSATIGSSNLSNAYYNHALYLSSNEILFPSGAYSGCRRTTTKIATRLSAIASRAGTSAAPGCPPAQTSAPECRKSP